METQEGSATEWESEADEVIVCTSGMRPTGMSDEDWGEEDLNPGYHPTSEIADEPPEMRRRRNRGGTECPTS